PLFILPLRLPPTSTLFPYTTLFRSRRRGSIHIAALQRQVRGQAAVLVPAAMVKLDEAYAPLGHTPRKETIRGVGAALVNVGAVRSEEHTSELQSRENSYAVFCLKKK